MIEPGLQQDFVVTREGTTLYTSNPILADATGLSVTPAVPRFLIVTLDGFTTGSGTVTVTGTDSNDDALSEVFTFTSEGALLGSSEFKTITRVQSSGLTDEATVGSVLIEPATEMGERVATLSAVATIRGRFLGPKSTELAGLTGLDSRRIGRLIVNDTDARLVLVGDKLVYDSEDWEIVEIAKYFDAVGNLRHAKLILNQFEGQ